MRLFTAVELDPPVAEAVAHVVSELRGRAERQAPSARVTWIPRERLHLTLRFIGEVAEPLVEPVVSSLARPLPVEPFPVSIEGTGAFPLRGAPRVFWAGLGEGGAGLSAAADQVSARLAVLGFEEEDREYRPHLTLARVRDGKGLRTAALLDGLRATRFGTFVVKTITLFESRLSSKGPEYVVVQRTPLTPAASS